MNTFDDNDLNYRAEQTNGKPLPPWLIFLPRDRKFEGTPPEFIIIHLRLIATDNAQ